MVERIKVDKDFWKKLEKELYRQFPEEYRNNEKFSFVRGKHFTDILLGKQNIWLKNKFENEILDDIGICVEGIFYRWEIGLTYLVNPHDRPTINTNLGSNIYLPSNDIIGKIRLVDIKEINNKFELEFEIIENFYQ